MKLVQSSAFCGMTCPWCWIMAACAHTEWTKVPDYF